MDDAYTFGLGLMARSRFPFSISIGATIVRVLRELDHDDARQDRAWLAVRAILDAQHRI